MSTERVFVTFLVRLNLGGSRRQRYGRAVMLWGALSPLRFLLFCLSQPRLGWVAIKVRLASPDQLRRMQERERRQLRA